MLGLDPSISARKRLGNFWSRDSRVEPEHDDRPYAALTARPSATHLAYQLLKRRHSVST